MQLANEYDSQISRLCSDGLNYWRRFGSQRLRTCLRYRLFVPCLYLAGSRPRGTDSEQLPQGRLFLPRRHVFTDIER